MPPPQLTRAQILDQIKGDMRLELGADPMRRSPEYALALALTGQSKGLYARQRYQFAQLFPDSDTIDDASFWRWAGIYLEQPQKPALAWRGTWTTTGTNGTSLPTGTELTRSDSATYTVDAPGAVVAGGVVTVSITADLPGPSGSNDDGQPLSLSSSILGLDSDGTVVTTTQAGSDVETVDDAQLRLLLRLRTPPSGGGVNDYVSWALEVPGVTRAWEFPLQFGSNSVGLAFARDNDVGSPVPDSGERAQVLVYVNDRKPLTAIVTIITLVEQPIAFTIQALTPDTVAVRNAIELSLDDLFAREGRPGGTIALSRVDAAVSSAADEVSHVLVAPAAPIVSTVSQLPVRGPVTYV